MIKTVKLQVRVPVGLLAVVRRIAAAREETLTAVVMAGLREYVDRYGQQSS